MRQWERGRALDYWTLGCPLAKLQVVVSHVALKKQHRTTFSTHHCLALSQTATTASAPPQLCRLDGESTPCYLPHATQTPSHIATLPLCRTTSAAASVSVMCCSSHG